MREIVYSVRDLESEQTVAQLESAVNDAISANEILNSRIAGVEVSWLGETLSVKVEEDLDADLQTLLENTIKIECERLGCNLVTPPAADRYALGSQSGKKTIQHVPLSSAIVTVITVAVISALLTFALTTIFSQRETATVDRPSAMTGNPFEDLDLLDRLFKSVSLFADDLDDKAIVESVLKGYVSATGDRYAAYYNAEEYAALLDQQNGVMCGIGISVVSGNVTVDGYDYQTITITSVYSDSPAERAGLKAKDQIYAIGTLAEGQLVNALGYTAAVDMLLGEEGTYAEFVVLRENSDTNSNEPYNFLPFSVKREQLTHASVEYRVCESDSSVGVVRITGFNNTTAKQFSSAVDELLDKGCEYFVFDLRNNSGGLLTSVEDVMTYFLDKGDILIRVKDRTDVESSSTVMGAGINGASHSGSGELTDADVGKYKDLKFAVLVNEYTASAAELFSANIRDYELGVLVGNRTFGKGSVQTTINLAMYGVEGALKLTTRFYYPARGDGFDGVGITPDHELELSEEAKQYNINLLPDVLDNQLQCAITEIKNK